MSEGVRIPLVEARMAADIALALLGPACERIEVAGSIRREAPDVGDIEVVAVPRRGPQTVDLFGSAVGDAPDYLHDLCNRLRAEGRLAPRLNKLGHESWGRKLKWGYFWPTGPADGRIAIDINACERDQWGATLAIRTGPADFSRRLVTARPAGGYCPPHLHFRDWQVVEKASGEPRPTPEERDVFAVLGLDWIEPRDRR